MLGNGYKFPHTKSTSYFNFKECALINLFFNIRLYITFRSNEKQRKRSLSIESQDLRDYEESIYGSVRSSFSIYIQFTYPSVTSTVKE